MFRPGASQEERTAADEQFVLLRPMVLFSPNDVRTELAAYMTASSDVASYGQMTAYVLTGTQVDGPRTVANQIELNSDVARQISAQTAGGTGNRVRFGDLQLFPIGDGLLYVRPMYVAVQQTQGNFVTEYAAVTVSHEGRVAIGDSLAEALAELFPGFEGDLGDRVGGEVPENDETCRPATGEPSTEIDDDPATLLGRAEQLLVEADEQLAAGDLGAYQARVDEAGMLVGSGLRPARRRRLKTEPAVRIGPDRADPNVQSAVFQPLAAGSADLFGQPGQILAERDLVAGLFVGQSALAVAQLADHDLAHRRRRRAGRPALRCHRPARSPGWPARSTRR